MLDIAVFSGGRGTRSIQDAFSGVQNVRVTYLINGYDSGLSTGEVRRIIPGMLGPSDFRKALTGIGRSYETNGSADLARLFEFRLPLEAAEAETAFAQWENPDTALEFIGGLVPALAVEKALKVAAEIARFTRYVREQKSPFDCTDLAVGNAYFGGAFLATGGFNAALDQAKELFELPETVDILNVTTGDDLWLATTTATPELSVEEGHFVTTAPPAPIDEVILIGRDTFYDYRDTHSVWSPVTAEQLADVRSRTVIPRPNPAALERLAAASVIVYGSGTLHSSLIPSYITDDVVETIGRNESALKVLFVNGSRDVDIHESVPRPATMDLYATYFHATTDAEFARYVSEIWISGGGWDETPDDLTHASESRGVPIRQLTDESATKYTETDSYLAFSRALSRHVGVTLGSKSRLASIVIPMLDEARQLPQLKESLDLLGKTEAGSLIEIIVADGGSADGSREIVEHWPDVRLVRAGEGSGRGTAIRDGVAASRGRTVCVFHADNEYAPDDAEKLLALAEASPSTLYIASRTHGAGGAYALRKIYSGHRFQYWVSRTGGVLVSAVLSLRLGRVISDPFCGVLAGQHDLVAQHFRYAGDVSSTIRGIMSAHRAGVPIVEVGVSYQPRDRAAGKKTGVRAGLGALWAATVR